MKKLQVIALAFVAFVMLFSSCKKTDESNTALLCYKNGWVLSEATSSPAYKMSGGENCTDLLLCYLEDCEKDDVIAFTEDGGQTINPKEVCTEWGIQSQKACTWKFNEDETVLYCQLPFFYNDNEDSYNEMQENCKVMSLTADELKLSYTFEIANEETKAAEQYTFYMTYVHAKK